MKKILSMIAALMVLTACELKTSDNGDLDGFWQLTQMDTLSTNRSGDVRSMKIFWAVQGDMLEMRDLHSYGAEDQHEMLNFRFKLEQGRLYLSEPIANDRNISDSIVTSTATVEFYGLSRTDEVLDVLQLSAEKMTLQTELYRMYFRKY
ncbi:MAG: lipocalin-like domain-containing protein [Prevotella sp.]|nr:lipocalin-like domain-containing protein [Prevotella sp.]